MVSSTGSLSGVPIERGEPEDEEGAIERKALTGEWELGCFE